ncbi:hypothetical protein BC939DRAFT_333221 [Gamsiella multidivaricata]|uniref:uncharacterized protein n=1 Tax=Gamsiella multidivaricata TaxID=101098 RepID=UPI002220CC85|nr:uncharacterized protein BC939DRAFT_333221 [Gamsiella multidivaricata]KAG0368220.1 hypothetical protein BGZ54_002458 [Gamsiella multidivaricata]KAI7817318.1 hypothetical protein BC939DRAFT_333221 [Gamsiella multidivaricata]
MNLSQILNPPGASVAPLSESTHVGRGQGRTSSPLPPTALVSTTTVLRFDTPLNGSPGGTSARKHANSVSVAQLEEQSAHHPNTGKHNSSSTSNSPHPKIKPNEISNGYSTHTFRANAPVQSVAVTKEKAPATFTTDNSAASNGPSGTRTGTGIGAQAAAAGITDTFSQGQKNHNVPQGLSSSTSTAKKRPRSQASRSGKTSFLFISPTPSAQQESKNGSLRKVGRPTLMVMDDDAQPHGRPSPRLSEDDAQPLEIRFVMTDKDGQDKQRTMKPTTPSTPKSDSPARDSQGEDSTDQELSSTPDFERNADGKYVVCYACRLATINARHLLELSTTS